MRGVVRGLLLALLAAALLATSGAPAAAAEASQVPASSLTERPYRSITLVVVGDNVICTGFIIGRRKVATAAHCLTRNASEGDYRLRQGLPGNVRLLRAYSQAAGGTPYRACRASRVWAHGRFVRRDRGDRAFGSPGHDYAVITTAPGCAYPANAVMRLWGTVPFDGQLRVDQAARMAGYPADPRYEGMSGANLWRTTGSLLATGADTRLLNTTGFVAQGMSGAPLWRSFRGDSPCGRSQCVIGILTECEVNNRKLCKRGDSLRRAVRITPAVKRILKRR